VEPDGSGGVVCTHEAHRGTYAGHMGLRDVSNLNGSRRVLRFNYYYANAVFLSPPLFNRFVTVERVVYGVVRGK